MFISSTVCSLSEPLLPEHGLQVPLWAPRATPVRIVPLDPRVPEGGMEGLERGGIDGHAAPEASRFVPGQRFDSRLPSMSSPRTASLLW